MQLEQRFNGYHFVKMSEDHKDLIRNWRNQDNIRKYMYTDHIISEEEHAKWFAGALINASYQGLVLCYEGKPIGFVPISNIDKQNQTCFWGFYIAEDSAPRGSGTTAEYMALEYMFHVLNIRKISCEVLDFNENVIKMHGKFGFEEEGVFKAHYVKENKELNVHRLALFADQWAERSEAMKDKINSYQQKG